MAEHYPIDWMYYPLLFFHSFQSFAILKIVVESLFCVELLSYQGLLPLCRFKKLIPGLNRRRIFFRLIISITKWLAEKFQMMPLTAGVGFLPGLWAPSLYDADYSEGWFKLWHWQAGKGRCMGEAWGCWFLYQGWQEFFLEAEQSKPCFSLDYVFIWGRSGCLLMKVLECLKSQPPCPATPSYTLAPQHQDRGWH